ncbi:energy-dependent translational throttle protein EttA [bacterium]|nr:energy-dependent translational throttle protein EttA [bacterium]
MKPGQPIFTINELRRRFGDREVLKGLTFSLYPGDRVGIIGVNGSGKSTLMKILAGEDTEFEGVAVPSKDLTIGIVGQEPQLDPKKTVRENIEEGVAHVHALLKRYDEINEALGTEADAEKMQELLDEQSSVQAELDSQDAWEVDRKLEVAMEALRTPPPDRDVVTLSGGERRRVSLCKVLMNHPDLLILDEPTNHLDADTIEWLETFLAGYTGSYILVTHDRYFLDRVANRMLEIDRGLIFSYKGNYSDYLEQKQKLAEIQKRTDDNREAHLRRELEWIRQTPAARRVKSKARIKDYERLLEEHERSQEDMVRGDVELRLPSGPRLPNKVVVFENVKKGFGGKTLIDGLTFELPPGGIIGVTGPNGAGKTTLAKLILGVEKPDLGTITVGKNTIFCYVDQGRDTLNPEKTVYEEVADGADFLTMTAGGPGGVEKRTLHVRHYLARFLFTGSIQQTRVGDLSGGERNRVQLAKLLRKGGNVIILDEPTNDLDLQTLRVLEEALASFPGCAIVITHDRYFLNRVATHIIAFEGDGKVLFSEGGYEIYQERKKRRDEEAGIAAQSNKAKHRKMLT